jgi:hypothetical protein
MTYIKSRLKIVDKYLDGGKLTHREAAILGHLHTLSFGKKIKRRK